MPRRNADSHDSLSACAPASKDLGCHQAARPKSSQNPSLSLALPQRLRKQRKRSVSKLERVQVNLSATPTTTRALKLHLRAMDRGIPNHQIEVSKTCTARPSSRISAGYQRPEFERIVRTIALH